MFGLQVRLGDCHPHAVVYLVCPGWPAVGGKREVAS